MVHPVYPEPPHCPYFATEQLPPPDVVVVAAADDLEVEVVVVRRVVLAGTEVGSLPEPGVYKVFEKWSARVDLLVNDLKV